MTCDACHMDVTTAKNAFQMLKQGWVNDSKIDKLDIFCLYIKFVIVVMPIHAEAYDFLNLRCLMTNWKFWGNSLGNMWLHVCEIRCGTSRQQRVWIRRRDFPKPGSPMLFRTPSTCQSQPGSSFRSSVLHNQINCGKEFEARFAYEDFFKMI